MDRPQLDLFAPAIAASATYDIAVTPEVSEWLAAGAVCALGVSGGKDSQAMAIRLAEYLDKIDHKGPRLLIHSDLGAVEWKDSLPVCERLAKRLGWELIVLRRTAGDMMDRWETRWASSLERYATLSCVKIILPWSTPGMRFCTSELKTDLICRELTKRYPGQKILSATGVRHDESTARAKMPIAAPQPKLSARGCQGMNWNPIAPWSTPSVYEYIALKQEPLHEAYTTYGSTRVSCAFCIMGSAGDLKASASCPDNAVIYRRMVRLRAKRGRSPVDRRGAPVRGQHPGHLRRLHHARGSHRPVRRTIRHPPIQENQVIRFTDRSPPPFLRRSKLV